MICKKEFLEAKEERSVQPYATLSKNTIGRECEEDPPEFRTHFQRDWNRIAHAEAYRKLALKTQVFPFGEGDAVSRNRLTHTLETVQIATAIARCLGLNEDLVRAISMAHDLGHPPFGHSGEETLSKCVGHFNHNEQSLRVVRQLENKYVSKGFLGLNLTKEVLEGIQKHVTDYDKISSDILYFKNKSPSLEAQIVPIADTIAYRTADLDDAYRISIMEENKILSEVKKLLKDKQFREIEGIKSKENKRYLISRELINRMILDVLFTTEADLEKHGIKTLEDVRNCPTTIVCFSSDFDKKQKNLGRFLLHEFYHNYKIVRMTNKGKRVVKDLFEEFRKGNQEILPIDVREKIRESRNLSQCLIDYIAGMTDKCAIEEHKKLFEIVEKV